MAMAIPILATTILLATEVVIIGTVIAIADVTTMDAIRVLSILVFLQALLPSVNCATVLDILLANALDSLLLLGFVCRPNLSHITLMHMPLLAFNNTSRHCLSHSILCNHHNHHPTCPINLQ
ncbi:hypothetical protein Pyn_15614 [Prunus yedoensis var. nudiflora]|uniref:Uncharacterized protein n=1 Tax=Prunus yedoensis var. nudiflora TaxID=2094558 RepID=A0A314YBZ0_PRUYE|nr:hypothetical protein Pyn_15614 [Prunus yedoensis var. nudiflora]